MQEHDDREFEALAIAAEIPDVPVAVEPLTGRDMMRPCEADGLRFDPRSDDRGPDAVVAGCCHVLLDCRGIPLAGDGDDWRETTVLLLVRTTALSAVFDAGPGDVIGAVWWERPLPDGVSAICCTMSTAATTTAPPRRFTILVPPFPEIVEAAKDSEMIALTLIDLDDPADEGGDELKWFVLNDSDVWAAWLSHTSSEGR